MTKDITLIVLAGGIGKRMWPLSINKALYPFFGMPLFAHTIADVPGAVSKVIIVTNPENDAAIRSYSFPISTSTVIQKEPKGMADAILSCRNGLSDGPILIINVDDLVDTELMTRVVDMAQKTHAFGVIPGWKTSVYQKTGYLNVSGDRVVSFVEKPEPGREPSPYINVVVHFLANSTELVNELVKTSSVHDDVYETALSSLAARHPFELVPYEGPMAALKYPWHILDVMQGLFTELESYRGKKVEIKKNIVIEGAVHMGDNVKIFENTKIVGPCYIGNNTIIGNDSIIRESHIGADSVVGFNCDITRSYVGDNCWLHMNYVGDSVLEGDISMGGGAKLANLRLDDGEISSVVNGKKVSTGRNKLGSMIGKGVRIGVNASIMPGVKIGQNSFIGSGVVLDRDLPDGSFCVAKPGYVVTKNLKNAPVSRDTFKKKI